MPNLSSSVGAKIIVALVTLVNPGSANMDTTTPLAEYTQTEIKAVQAFWSQNNRFSVKNNDGSKGLYQARQTPEGSTWLLNYFKSVRGAKTKVNPGKDPEAQNQRQKEWDAWVESKYTWDEFLAKVQAQKLTREKGYPVAAVALISPDEPQPMPQDLKELVSEPPLLVEAVLPQDHQINFGDFTTTLQDHVKVRRRYNYYRFHEGVMHPGTPMRGQSIDKFMPLFKQAGVSDEQVRVMSAVSLLEGGFDSINTYDTGYVSVGFIQFASLSGGGHSLGQVLLNMKKTDPLAFEKHFKRFGVSVTTKGSLVALDIESGAIKTGSEANQQIIKDKRLIATFHRAGQLSNDFKAAQIKTALDLYYPADDKVTININGKKQTGTIGDIFRTEAGLATMMDRKVNTGNFGNLVEVLEDMAYTYGLENFEDLAQLEYQLCRVMAYRKDYLEVNNLQKPRDLGLRPSRGGERGGSTGGGGSE